MATGQLPGLSPVEFTEALRLAAVRKTKAEEERKRKEAEEQARIMQIVKPVLSLAATAYGGPAAGAATSAALPVAEKFFRSLGE